MRGHVRNADARTFWLLLLAAVGLTGCDRMTYWVNKGYMDKIEKKPHTAHIFDYAVTFPRPSEIRDQIPGGLESGIGWFMFNPANEDGSPGEEGVTYSAEWQMANGGGEMDFVVIDKLPAGSSSKPPELPPRPEFQNVVRTEKGTIDAAGLHFTVSHWKGDYNDAVTSAKGLFGVDYAARDENGRIVGLRGVALGTPTATENLTTRVLKTMKRMPTKITTVTRDGEPPVDEPYELIMP